jgi:adenosylhomocysteine nucleosidase
MNILVAGALFHELKPLLEHLKHKDVSPSSAFRIRQAEYLAHQLVVVITGVGTSNSKEAVAHSLENFRPDLIISIGFGGALYSEAQIGDLVIAESIFLVSANSIKKTIPIPDHSSLLRGLDKDIGLKVGTFFTLEAPTKKEAVNLLVPAQLPRPVCEMETFPIAGLALERQIPFLAVRSITDLACEDIPFDLFSIPERGGDYRLISAAGVLFRKPQLIPMAAKLAIRSRKASKRLWQFFEALARIL